MSRLTRLSAIELEHLGSLERLRAAGILADFGGVGDERWVSFSDDYLTLLNAGINPLTEPDLIALWLSGGAGSMRRCLEQAAEIVRREAR